LVDPSDGHWPRDALPKGTELNGFRLEAMLGRGGFGITYRAVDAIDQSFAIKECFPRQFATRQGLSVYPASATETDIFADCIERFTREAKALRQLSALGSAGGSVVKVVTFFGANGTGYLVMEYLPGANLDAVITAAPRGLPTEQIVFMLPRLLQAVGGVHDAGLLHRDIKPANILLRADGAPVLIDFGAVRDALNPDQTSVYTQIYSESYAPIEQMTGGKQGTYSDLYGLGATFYRAIGGKTVTSVTRNQAVLHGMPDPQPPAAQIGRGRYPPAVLATIDAALTIDPYKRPQTIRDLIRMLEGPGGETTFVPPPKPAKSRRLPQMLAAAAGIALISGVGYWMIDGQRTDNKRALPDDGAVERKKKEADQAFAAQASAARDAARALEARARSTLSAQGFNADAELSDIDRAMAQAEAAIARGDNQAALDGFTKLAATIRQSVGAKLDGEIAWQRKLAETKLATGDIDGAQAAVSAGKKLQQAAQDFGGEPTPPPGQKTADARLSAQASAARDAAHTLAARAKSTVSGLGLSTASFLSDLDGPRNRAESEFNQSDYQAALDDFTKLQARIRQETIDYLDREAAANARTAQSKMTAGDIDGAQSAVSQGKKLKQAEGDFR
jgi:serine/threonine protein kinase